MPGEETPWVLVVVEDVDNWTNDYKLYEHGLMQKYGIFSARATFSEIAREAKVDPQTNVLYFRDKEIGLIYFRCGWHADHHIVKKPEDIAAGINYW